LNAELNGKAMGEFAIASPFDFTRQTFSVGPGVLRPGLNTVRVSISQHHRVDCSLEATYELWTDLDPAISGFKPASPRHFASMDDLFGAGRLENGVTDLRVILPTEPDATLLKAASDIVQALSLYLGRSDIQVRVSDAPGEGPGLDLYVSDGARLANAESSAILNQAPLGVSIRPGQDPSRPAVIFRAEGRSGLDALLIQAVKGPMAAGLKDIRRKANFEEIRVAAGDEFSLKDIGIRSQTFEGRMMRTHFDVVMPADFYPAEYGAVDLKLHAATAPGLDPTAQMLVRINGSVVNAFPFRNADGQNFNGKLIRLPLRSFHPGVNKVELLAELPRATDKACAPATREDSKPRYVFLDKTSIKIPELARVTRLPDLAAFAGNGYPYAAGDAFAVYLDTPDAASSGAALTLMARLAQSAGMPLQGDFHFGAPSPDAVGDALVIGAKFEAAASAVAAPAFSLEGDTANAQDSEKEITSAVSVDTEAVVDNQLMAAFQAASVDKTTDLSLSARAKALAHSLGARFGSWLNYEDAKPVSISPNNTLLTVAQMANANGAGAITEIRANSTEDLALGVKRLVSPDIWNQLDGGAALISAQNLALVDLPGKPPSFSKVTEQSVGNYRRIAAAWLSDNFQIYIGLVIATIGLFAACLGYIVQRKGVRTAK